MIIFCLGESWKGVVGSLESVRKQQCPLGAKCDTPEATASPMELHDRGTGHPRTFSGSVCGESSSALLSPSPLSPSTSSPEASPMGAGAPNSPHQWPSPCPPVLTVTHIKMHPPSTPPGPVLGFPSSPNKLHILGRSGMELISSFSLPPGKRSAFVTGVSGTEWLGAPGKGPGACPTGAQGPGTYTFRVRGRSRRSAWGTCSESKDDW